MEESTRDSKFLFHLLYFLLVMFARILIYLLLAFFVIRGCTQCYHFYLRSEWINPAQNELRPGKYRLNTTMNYDQIINQLTMSD